MDLKECSSRTAPHRNKQGVGCSNKGFLPISAADLLSLLDWTARQQREGSGRGNKRGSTPKQVAPLFERLGINVDTRCRLVKDFGRLFSVVAGQLLQNNLTVATLAKGWDFDPGMAEMLPSCDETAVRDMFVGSTVANHFFRPTIIAGHFDHRGTWHFDAFSAIRQRLPMLSGFPLVGSHRAATGALGITGVRK